MVAETAKIARSDIETVGLHPAVFFVLLKEKRLVDDTASYDVGRETAADDYLVETPPLAMIAVGALGPMRSHGPRHPAHEYELNQTINRTPSNKECTTSRSSTSPEYVGSCSGGTHILSVPDGIFSVHPQTSLDSCYRPVYSQIQWVS